MLTLRIRSVSIKTSLSIMLSFNSSSLKDDIRDTDGRRRFGLLLVLVLELRRDGSRDMDGRRLSSSVAVLLLLLMGDLDCGAVGLICNVSCPFSSFVF